MIVLLLGPTAAGKTELACALADDLPVDLISMDSAMVYRGMDIGTAKPSPSERARYPHQLIDIRDPAQPYSAASFVADADRAVQAALARDRIPLIVGGSMLYAKAFREGLAELPSADVTLREQIARRAQDVGWAALHEELTVRDPEAAAGIHPHNTQRIQRALEVIELTGGTLSQAWRETGQSVTQRLGVKTLTVAMEVPRATLHQRIEHRFEHMLAQGFVAEVAGLRGRGDLDPSMPSMRAVGYRQIWQHLEGETSFSQMHARGLAATRQLAKKQQTWLRRFDELITLSGTLGEMVHNLVACVRR